MKTPRGSATRSCGRRAGRRRRDWILHHHERLDGSGYPDGLSGDEIPIESRIIVVADAFEAMTADRPYSAAPLARGALAELERCSGTQFDAGCVEALRAASSASCAKRRSEARRIMVRAKVYP